MVKRANEVMNDSIEPPLPIPPPFLISQDFSTVDYESQEEKDDSGYRVAFSNTMDKSKFRNSSFYQRVEVLLLRWADSHDDLAIEREVEDLKNVFEQRFNFHAQIESLDPTLDKNLQVQINCIVATFVAAHDGQDTLLIVYYAGHGKPGPIHGQLELFGKRSPNDEQSKWLDSVVWNKTEEMLRPATADILEIFDCCYAGTLGLTRGQPRFFEYLAATGATGLTPHPGKTSFTSALIFALKRMLETKPEGRFTTSELLAEIIDNAPHFSKEQRPMMRDREGGTRTGRIMLHPLPEGNSDSSSCRNYEIDINQAKQHALTLHFDFDEKPSIEHVTDFGNQLISMFEHNTLKINRIRWGGVKPSMVARITNRLQVMLARQRRENAMKAGVAGKLLLAGQIHDQPTPSPEIEDRIVESLLVGSSVESNQKAFANTKDSIEISEEQAELRSNKRRRVTGKVQKSP